MASALSLELILPEIRPMIFNEAMAEKEDARNLIAALLPLYRNGRSSLYTEALHSYYMLHTCLITAENMDQVEKLSETIKLSVQNLRVQFSLAETFKAQKHLSCQINPHTNAIISTETVVVKTVRTRINPKPSYLQTLAPYPNINHLCLESQVVGYYAFHQIEGMIIEALKRHSHLERIEVRSETVDWYWHLNLGGDGENNFDRWAGRLNAGTGVRAQLSRVSTFGGEECWIWQAAPGRTLGWKEPVTRSHKRKRL